MSPPKLLGQTPSQTVGPFFAYGLVPEQYGYGMQSLAGPVLADETVPGLHITIEGQVLDGQGAPITDALVEIWQADADGSYVRQPGTNARFTGFGRCGTGTEADATFRFRTIKPGAPRSAAEHGGPAREAPHINLVVLMRGLLVHAFTRIYFPDEGAANARDPLLLSVPAERRDTLLARRIAPAAYRFDVHMQGNRETVFLDL